MEININAYQALMAQIFGVAGSAFNPKIPNILGDVAAGQAKQGVYGSPYYATNILGQALYLPVTVVYTNSSGKPVTYTLPYCVIEIDVAKHVVDTELTERNGLVSELINTGAYKIGIKGLLINKQANELPESDLINLRNLFECNVPITIQSVLTDIYLKRPDNLGSCLVTIRRKKVPYATGVKHVKAYEMDFISETPFSLIEI